MSIAIEKLSKSFKQGKKVSQALQNITLHIAEGDIYGIIGLSGAGKSTLLRVLAGLLEPTSGSISIDLKNIGMIFQHFNLLSSRTVAENIAFPLEIARVPVEKKVDHLLRLVGLQEKRDAYPAHLSGGEKQRVGIARALANDPKILFCDEATSALDPKTTKEILALLKNIHQTLGITIVLITHEMEVIKAICNRVAVLDQGTIVEEGEVADIFADPKHPITKNFLHHEIPLELIKPYSPHRKLLRLRFKGESSNEPVISQIVKRYQVEANIMQGWIDYLQTVSIGTLIIELTGTPENMTQALQYLEEKKVHVEQL